MRTQANENQKSAMNLAPSSEALAYSSQMTYHEMAEIPVRENNVIEQLHANLESLSDLHSRMQFMNREIRYLMKI